MKRQNRINRGIRILLLSGLLFATGCSQQDIAIDIEISVNGQTDDQNASLNPESGSNKTTLHFKTGNGNSSASVSISPGIATDQLISIQIYQNGKPVIIKEYRTDDAGNLIPSDQEELALEPGSYLFLATIPGSSEAGDFSGYSQMFDIKGDSQIIELNFAACLTEVIVKLSAPDVRIRSVDAISVTSSDKNSAGWNELQGMYFPATVLTDFNPMNLTKSDQSWIGQTTMVPLIYTGNLKISVQARIEEQPVSEYFLDLPIQDGKLEAGKSYIYEVCMDSNRLYLPITSIDDWHEIIVTDKPIIATPL